MRNEQKFILILLLISFTTAIEAQNNNIDRKRIKKNAKVVFDYNAKGIRDTIYQYRFNNNNSLIQKTVEKIWYSRRVTLQVKINPYLYDVFVKARQVNDEGVIDSTALRLFSAAVATLSENKALLDTTKKKTQSTEVIQKPLDAETVISTISEKIDATPVQQQFLAKELTTFQNAEVIADSVTSSDMTNFLSTANLNKAQQQQLVNEAEKIKAEKAIYENIKVKRDIFYSNIGLFHSAVTALEDEFDICEYATLLCLSDKASNQEIVTSVRDYLQAENFNITNDSFLNKLPGELAYYKKNMDNAYKNLLHSYNDVVETLQKLDYFFINTSFDSTLKANNDTLYVNYSRIKPEVFAKGFTLLYRNLKNPESFTHTCPPELTDMDTLIYNIDARPSERFKPLIEKYGIKLYNAGSFDYRIPVKGNFKLNFSVGAAFMLKNLRPKEYFFDTPLESLTNDSDKVTIQEKPSGNRFMPAIAAYAHGYLKLGGWFTPAITVGLSTNPTDFSNASYFLGASLVCGQQSRFIFTIGIAGSSVDVLKSKYEVGKDYIKKNFLNIQEADLTKKAFKSGIFWGVSYNISSNR